MSNQMQDENSLPIIDQKTDVTTNEVTNYWSNFEAIV